MAKRRTDKTNTSTTPLTLSENIQEQSILLIKNFKTQLFILIAVVFAFYGNTLSNKYALDDQLVLYGNDLVKEGFSGIPKILSNDAFYSYYKAVGANNQLSGGRYRPLSIVTFAMEWQFFGENPFISHLLNIVFYALTIALLFYLLYFYLLPKNKDAAFVISLLFAIHPIHTEVVANIKSRDEILSLLAIISSFILLFKHKEKNKMIFLVSSLFCYFLALLSKEYAVILILLMPFFFYIFFNNTILKGIYRTLPFVVVAAIYIYMRLEIVGLSHFESNEVLNNPYLYATPTQLWASKIAVFARYIMLLFFPHPLSSDYSYNHIPYSDLGSPIFILSLALHIALVYFMFSYLKKRHIFAFAIAFYLLNLFMISNVVLEIGATMGERLVYHSSLGFAIITGLLLVSFFEKFKAIKPLSSIVLVLLITFCGVKTIARNQDWKDNQTLFAADVKTVPNSALTRCSLGSSLLSTAESEKDSLEKNRLLNESEEHLQCAKQIHPTYVKVYLQLGVAKYYRHQYDSAKYYWDKAKALYPTNYQLPKYFSSLANAYKNSGLNAGKTNQFKEAESCFLKALSIDSLNAETWFYLAGAHYELKEFAKAKNDFARTLQLNPNHVEAQRGYNALSNMK